MSIFLELTRLEARYASALVSPLSCPRNREILRTKIEGLEEEVSKQRSWTERQLAPPGQPKEYRQQDDMRLWEQEQGAW